MKHGLGRRIATTAAVGVLGAGLVAACGTTEDTETSGDDEAIVMYSGRSEDLVGPLIPRLEEAADVTIDVRYGSTSELAAQLAEEGEASPADIFFSQDAGALGSLERAGALATLSEETVNLVADGYQAADDTWVATSLRARVLFYDSEALEEDEVPATIDELVEPEWNGRVAYAPGNASFQSFVTALRVDRGDDEAEQWLTDFLDNDPVAFENNGQLLDAVDAGEVELGLSNHYYWYNKSEEVGEDSMAAAVQYLEPGDPGALVNVAGVGVLESSDRQDDAVRVIDAMLSDESQQFFLDETSEYPVVDSVSVEGTDLPPLESLSGPDIDLADLESLEDTQAMLQRVGMI